MSECLGAQKAAKTDSGDATVQRVNVEAGNVLALLLDVNVTLMFAGTAGLGNHFHNVSEVSNYISHVFLILVCVV